MGLLQKLKSLFGSDQSGQSTGSGSEPDVTVEREPAAESEHAVKGTDGADTAISQQSQDTGGQQAAGTAPTDGDGTDPTGVQTGDNDADEGLSLEEIKGIGPTYADRLGKAGYETVADLAVADAEAVAEAAETGEGRASDWIERAQDF